MTTKAQAAKAVETPAAVKQAAARKSRAHAPKVGVVEGPTGKNMPAAQDLPEVTEEQRKGERRQAQENAVAQFTPTEQTTPAVHEPTEEEKKLAALQEGVKALAVSLGLDPAAVMAPVAQTKPAAKRADRVTQNNITRPGETTLCGRIWAVADKISADQNGQPATIAQVREHADLQAGDVSIATIKTQYARWRQFHGIKGRAVAPQVATKSPEGRDEGIEQAFNRRATDKH